MIAAARDEPIALVAAEGLPGVRTWPHAKPLDDGTFHLLLERVAAEKLTGHLVRVIETGALPATDDQHLASARRHDTALAADLTLERLLVATSGTLGKEGIVHRALKGPVLARTAYPDPALRSFADIDVLVESSRFDDAVALLVADGGHRRFADPRPHFTSRFGKGVCVVTSRSLEIDLHRVFSSGPFGLAIDDDDLFHETDSIDVGGVAVPALGATLRFLHACYHAALGGPRTRLTAVRDVAQIAAATDLDLDAALDVAARWRGRAVVAHAAQLVSRRLAVDGAGLLTEWADDYRPDRFERHALAAYTADESSYASQAAAGLWALRGMRHRASYTWALLFPKGSYIRDREGTYLRRLRHAVSLSRANLRR